MILNPYTTKPMDLKPGDKLGYVCVAVVGDWAAYYGLTEMTPEQVASNGDEMDEDAAKKLFPVCRNLKWRY